MTPMTPQAPSCRRLVAATGVAIGIVLAAACGTGDDGAFERIDSDDLFGLDQTTTTSTTTTTTTTIPESSVPLPPSTSMPSTTVPTEPIELYFASGNQLDVVVGNLSRDPSETRVIALLEEGPPPGDAGVGLRTFVEPGLITGVRESGAGFATVDLAGDAFDDIEDRDQRLAIGQIVLTLTRRPGIGQVQFSLEGEPLAVPGGDGVQTEPGAPVSRADYEDLLGDGLDDPPLESTPEVSDPPSPSEPVETTTPADPTTPST